MKEWDALIFYTHQPIIEVKVFSSLARTMYAWWRLKTNDGRKRTEVVPQRPIRTPANEIAVLVYQYASIELSIEI